MTAVLSRQKPIEDLTTAILKGRENTYVEALVNKDRQVHNGLSLGECVNLIMSVDDLSSAIDEVWATFGKIGWNEGVLPFKDGYRRKKRRTPVFLG